MNGNSIIHVILIRLGNSKTGYLYRRIAFIELEDTFSPIHCSPSIKKAQVLVRLICRRHPPISATRGATWNRNISEVDRVPQIAVSWAPGTLACWV